jgi:ABC-2 type transport system permease protein
MDSTTARPTMLRRFLRAWWLTLRIMKVTLRSQAEYRAEFITTVMTGIVWQSSIIVFATVILTRFTGMGHWRSGDVLLIAAVRMLGHGCYVLVFGRVPFDFHNLVQEGAISAYLLRPMPVYRQVQLSKFPTNAIGDLAVAVFLLIAAMTRSTVRWNVPNVAYLVCAVLGGMFVISAISTALSSATMHYPATGYWSSWTHELIETFGAYPLSILPRAVGGLLTFGLPLAFISYLPVGVLAGHSSQLGVPKSLAVASPLVGLLLFVASRLQWNASLRRFAGVNG